MNPIWITEYAMAMKKTKIVKIPPHDVLMYDSFPSKFMFIGDPYMSILFRKAVAVSYAVYIIFKFN